MPVRIISKFNCTGCGACWNICPQNCIESTVDEEGFPYPQVNVNACIDCGLCLKACPVENQMICSNINGEVYAAWSKDKNVRFHSTSGGAFSELALSILNMGGLVAGAAYDDMNLVHHIIISDKMELNKIRQSKYIQSDIGNLYCLIENYLKSGRNVLFCGAPCQVAGLKTYLQNVYDSLITIDFICRGMNSPKAYLYWLKELENTFGSRVSNVWFKYKENGWKKSPFCTRVDFENGQYHVEHDDLNSFMIGYLKSNLYLRPSCAECHFKGEKRYSDITLADFWKVDAQYDDDCGTSMVMINSDNGRQLFDITKDRLAYFQKSIAEIRKGNTCFDASVRINPRGREFLMRLGEKPFSELVKEYTKVPLYRTILISAKNAISRIKLFKSWT